MASACSACTAAGLRRSTKPRLPFDPPTKSLGRESRGKSKIDSSSRLTDWLTENPPRLMLWPTRAPIVVRSRRLGLKRAVSGSS